MTAAMTFPFRLFFRLPSLPAVTETGPRTSSECREHLIRLVSSDACTSEYGAQALMNLYPREF